MLPFLGTLQLTFRELWAKKVVIGLFIIGSLALLVVSFALNLDVVEGSLASIRLFGAEAQTSLSLEDIVFAVQSLVAGATYWLGILLALFASGPLFTTLVETGHIELLLSKPISRGRLLGGHIAGVWVTMLVLVLYLMGGIWLAMSIKSGVWNPRFLLSIGIVLAMFGVMYSVVVVVGVFTESTALALIVTYGLIFVSLVLAGVNQITEPLGPVGFAVFQGIYHTLPNFAEVTQIVSRLAEGQPVQNWYPFVSSTLFGAACYAMGTFRFLKRDF